MRRDVRPCLLFSANGLRKKAGYGILFSSFAVVRLYIFLFLRLKQRNIQPIFYRADIPAEYTFWEESPMSTAKAAASENPMGTRPVFRLLFSMAVPPILSMLIQSMYNIVDSIFVARVSRDALTAVSLAFPLQNLVLSVAVGIGVGISAVISQNLGAKNTRAADAAAANGLLLTAIHAVLFILFGLLFAKPFIGLFADDPDIYAMGCQYSMIVICFSCGNLFHIYFEKIFQATGNMLVPMVLMLIGALTNIILDPILIFGLFGFPEMGVAGAAATVTAQFVSCILSILWFFLRPQPIHLSFRGFRPDGGTIRKIYTIGIPSSVMMALPSVLVGLLNAILTPLSEAAVAMFGVYFKLQTFVYMPANGLVQGMRPLVSYNYGAGLHARMHRAVRLSLLTAGVIMTVGTLLFLLLPDTLLLLFDADAEMLAIGTPALRIISLGFIVSAVGVVLSGTFEALGRGGPSLAVSLLRQFLIIPPLALLLSRFWGLTGIWITFPIAEILAAAAAIFLYHRLTRQLSEEISS